MRWLIRRVLKRANGDVFEDDIHFGDTLGIGRGTDQAVYITDLRAALAHARVTAVGGGRYRVESLIAAGVRVDGVSEQNTTVKSGAAIDIGSTRIRLIDPPADYEAAVEITAIDEAQAEAARPQPKLTLADGGLGKRRWSWALLLLSLLVGLGVPRITLHTVGEPTLHPRIGEMLRRPDHWRPRTIFSAMIASNAMSMPSSRCAMRNASPAMPAPRRMCQPKSISPRSATIAARTAIATTTVPTDWCAPTSNSVPIAMPASPRR